MKLSLGFGFVLIILFMSCQKVEQTTVLSKEEMIKKGEYLVIIGGCNDCHTPKRLDTGTPVPDPDRLRSGHPQNTKLPDIDPALIGPGKWMQTNDHLTAWVGPWGICFSANLTPDEQTGTGLWSEENFLNAMHTGKPMGLGQEILPPMPWFNLSHAEDDDLKAIFIYLKSLKPVHNLVPGPIPPDQLARM